MMVSEVSRRYATALYQSAKSSGKGDVVLAELRALAKVFSTDAQIKAFIASPLTTVDQRRAVVQTALEGRVSPESANFIYLLAEKNRLSLFSEIAVAYEGLIDQDNGVTRGVVRSAAPLSAEAIKSLEMTINKVVNKSVILSFKEDPGLLGGLVAQVGGWTFDDSLDLHLKKMNEELNRRLN